MNDRRLVILGASGFIGSNIEREARSRGWDTLPLSSAVLDLTLSGAAKQLRRRLRPADVIVHSSAVAPSKSVAEVTRNLVMTQAVSEALDGSAVSQLIVMSSDAVYADSSGVISELTPAAPDSFHGFMSLGRELICETIPDVLLTTFRMPPVYGLGDTHDSYGPNRFIRQAVQERKIKLFGAGAARRDHVSVKDVAAIVVAAAEQQIPGIFNLASGKSESFHSVATLVAETIPGTKLEITGDESAPTFRHFDISNLLKSFNAIRPTQPREGIASLAQTMLSLPSQN